LCPHGTGAYQEQDSEKILHTGNLHFKIENAANGDLFSTDPEYGSNLQVHT
jgi:hypothetical protein